MKPRTGAGLEQALYEVIDTSDLNEHDFAPTPQPLADEIMVRVSKMFKRPNRILEPSAGDGNFIKGIRKVWGKVNIVAMDIDGTHAKACSEVADSFHVTDFLEWNEGPRPDMIIGNPPYKNVEAHVAHALDLLPIGGQLIFLIPLAFCCSQKRTHGIMMDFMQLKFTMPVTPRFTTSQFDTMVYIWERNWAGPATWESHVIWK